MIIFSAQVKTLAVSPHIPGLEGRTHEGPASSGKDTHWPSVRKAGIKRPSSFNVDPGSHQNEPNLGTLNTSIRYVFHTTEFVFVLGN